MYRWWIAGAVLLGLAWAQPLTNLLPSGATAGLALASSQNQPQLGQLGRDWLESGLEAALGDFLASAKIDADLLGLAQGGLAAAVYPEGEVFLVAQPSEKALSWFRQQTQGGSLQAGWRSKPLAGQPLVVGLNQRQVAIASPTQWRRFIAGQRGTSPPLSGYLVLWINRPASLASPDQLPPTLLRWLGDLEQWALAVKLTSQGLETEGRLTLSPQASRESRQFWLGQSAPWSVESLPAASQLSSGSWNPAITQQLLNNLLGELGLEEQLSLAGLGSRYASLTPQTEGKPGEPVWIVEVVQRSQAEASLQALARWLTAFTDPDGRASSWSSPDGQGLRRLDLGMSGPVFLQLASNRLYLSSSSASLLAVTRSTRMGQWPTQLRGKIPPDATGYTFGPSNNFALGPLGDALGLLGVQASLEKALTRWFDALAPRLGSSYSYTQVRGNQQFTRGFLEVRWANR